MGMSRIDFVNLFAAYLTIIGKFLVTRSASIIAITTA